MNAVHSDPSKLAQSTATSSSQLRLSLSGVLELPCVAHAKTEDLEQIRALLELCESKAREVEVASQHMEDHARRLACRAA